MAVDMHTESDRLRSESPLLASDDAAKPKKRAHADEDEQQPSKRSKKQKRKHVDDAAIDSELNVNHAIAHMDSSLMADHIAQRTKRFQPEISPVESDDLRIPGDAIRDTTSFEPMRTAEHLPEYLEQFAISKGKKKAKLSSSSNVKGSPHTIVIAGAGLRAADLTRAVRKFQTKESMVAKLFAKHIKLKEASDLVSKTRIGIGVGTPQRITDLIENGSLKLDALERIVIDASHIDQKKRGILDMKEVQVPLIVLLTRPELKARYTASQRPVELLFF